LNHIDQTYIDKRSDFQKAGLKYTQRQGLAYSHGAYTVRSVIWWLNPVAQK